MEIPITFLETTTTTQDVCQRLSTTTEKPFAVLAKQQTAGRGTRGRSWQSDAGNLYLSLAAEILTKKQIGILPIVISTSIANALSLKKIKGFAYKWPNDIYINQQKLCGILIEKTNNTFVIGIGLNILHSPKLPDRKTTSLKEEGHLDAVGFLEREDLSENLITLARKIASKATTDISSFESGNCEDFLQDFRSKLWRQPGEEVSITTWNESFTGTFHGIGSDGDLILININGAPGSYKSFFYGDIF